MKASKYTLRWISSESSETCFVTQIDTTCTDLILFWAVKSRRTVKESTAPVQGPSHATGTRWLIYAPAHLGSCTILLVTVPKASLKAIPVSWVGEGFTLLKCLQGPVHSIGRKVGFMVNVILPFCFLWNSPTEIRFIFFPLPPFHCPLQGNKVVSSVCVQFRLPRNSYCSVC